MFAEALTGVGRCTYCCSVGCDEPPFFGWPLRGEKSNCHVVALAVGASWLAVIVLRNVSEHDLRQPAASMVRV